FLLDPLLLFDECVPVGIEQSVYRSEMLCEQLRHLLSDVMNPERIDHARERAMLAFFNRTNHVARGFLSHALQRRQRPDIELVQIDWGVHGAALDELIDELFPEAF